MLFHWLYFQDQRHRVWIKYGSARFLKNIGSISSLMNWTTEYGNAGWPHPRCKRKDATEETKVSQAQNLVFLSNRLCGCHYDWVAASWLVLRNAEEGLKFRFIDLIFPSHHCCNKTVIQVHSSLESSDLLSSNSLCSIQARATTKVNGSMSLYLLPDSLIYFPSIWISLEIYSQTQRETGGSLTWRLLVARTSNS
jgi:hypothetical protein